MGLVGTIEHFTKGATKWNREIFSDIGARKKILISHLSVVQIVIEESRVMSLFL